MQTQMSLLPKEQRREFDLNESEMLDMVGLPIMDEHGSSQQVGKVTKVAWNGSSFTIDMNITDPNVKF